METKDATTASPNLIQKPNNYQRSYKITHYKCINQDATNYFFWAGHGYPDPEDPEKISWAITCFYSYYFNYEQTPLISISILVYFLYFDYFKSNNSLLRQSLFIGLPDKNISPC